MKDRKWQCNQKLIEVTVGECTMSKAEAITKDLMKYNVPMLNERPT